MSVFQSYKQSISEALATFPPEVKKFLLRSFVLFIIWKGLYLFLWQTPRTLDGPLTNIVGDQSAWLFNTLQNTKDYQAVPKFSRMVIEGEEILSPISQLTYQGRKVVGIADGCNGLELFVLYIGFILAMPASIKRKLLFGIGGLAVIHVANILRCVGLGALLMHMDEYFEIAHHYVFKIVIYATIFALWVWFSQQISFLNPRHEAV
jgi:exosortase family protein XrtF